MSLIQGYSKLGTLVLKKWKTYIIGPSVVTVPLTITSYQTLTKGLWVPLTNGSRVSKELLLSFNLVLIDPLVPNIYSLIIVTNGGILEKRTEMEKKQSIGKWFIPSFILLFLYVSHGDSSCSLIYVALLNHKILSVHQKTWASKQVAEAAFTHQFCMKFNSFYVTFLVEVSCCEDNCASYRGSLAKSVSGKDCIEWYRIPDDSYSPGR